MSSRSSASDATRIERWRIVRSIIDFPGNRKTGSLGRLSRHLTDVTNASFSDLTRALSLELGSDVADKFAKRLHRAFSSSDKKLPAVVYPVVDARFIMTIYWATILAPVAFHNPKMVYLKLMEDYVTEDNSGGRNKSWLLTDVMRVVSIAATNDEEEKSTGVHLREQIQELTTSSIITMDIMTNALEMNPAVLQNFRTQMIAKLCENERLALMNGEEDASMHAFHLQLNKIIRERQRNFFTKIILRKAFAAWRMDLSLVMRSKRRKQKEAFAAWVIAVKRIKLSRLFTNLSHVGYCASQERRALRKLIKHMRIMKKIKRCCTSDDEKDICAGMGHLRIWMKKLSVRRAFSKWMSLHQQSIRLDVAQKWHINQVQRRVFRHFNATAMSEIASRRASMIQQKIDFKHINDHMPTSKASTSGYSDFHHTELRAKKEQIRLYDEARQRQKKLQKAIDTSILQEQQEQRKQRVAALRTQHEEQFQSAWASKKVETENACAERMKYWISTSDFKSQSQKRQKEVQKFFSLKHASTSNTERENAIASLSVISTSILDAKLAQVGSCFDDLFFRLEKLTSPINSIPFQSALASCGLIMAGSEFEDLFHGITKHDRAISKDASIEPHELQKLRILADKYIGHEGTRWKLYLNTMHQQQQLHNIFTNEKILEKDIGKKHIRRMVSENMQDNEMLKMRKNYFEARRHAHQAMLEHHAATSIQSLYRRFSGRQSRKKQKWILERRKLFRLRAKQAAAASLIQRRYRLSMK